MPVLLTGAGGFVGSHVLESLLDGTDEFVICTDSFRHGGGTDRIADALDRARHLPVSVLLHDLAAPFTAREVRTLDGVTAVIHVASYCQVDVSIEQPAEFIMNNVAATVHALDLARQVGARFVQMSTDEVFGDGWTHSPAHEPSSPYAASKAAQEDICTAYRRTYGMTVDVLSSGNMFGERQSQHAFIPRIVRAVIDGGDRLRVHARGGRWYTYVRNTADYITWLLGQEDAQDPRHYLAGQRRLGNLELVKLVGGVAGRVPEYDLIDAESVRPGYDVSYAALPRNDRWVIRHPFADALERTVRWYLKNLEWLEA